MNQPQSTFSPHLRLLMQQATQSMYHIHQTTLWKGLQAYLGRPIDPQKDGDRFAESVEGEGLSTVAVVRDMETDKEVGRVTSMYTQSEGRLIWTCEWKPTLVGDVTETKLLS